MSCKPVDVPQETINSFPTLNGEYRIEVHIYTNEWIKLANDLSELGLLNAALAPDYIPGLATRLLVVLSTHIKSLALDYFTGMLQSHQGQHAVTYMPCWKCFAEVGSGYAVTEDLSRYMFTWNHTTAVTCFGVEDSIVKSIKGENFECPFHGNIKVVHLAPDLVSKIGLVFSLVTYVLYMWSELHNTQMCYRYRYLCISAISKVYFRVHLVPSFCFIYKVHFTSGNHVNGLFVDGIIRDHA